MTAGAAHNDDQSTLFSETPSSFDRSLHIIGHFCYIHPDGLEDVCSSKTVVTTKVLHYYLLLRSLLQGKLKKRQWSRDVGVFIEKLRDWVRVPPGARVLIKMTTPPN